MRTPRSLRRYIPEALAMMAGVLTVLAVLPVAEAMRTVLFAGALVVAILGWLWTMREQRHLKEAQERAQSDHADRLAQEKARLERLLDGAISSQLGQGVQLDLAKSLADLARSLEAQIAACFLLEGDIGMLRPQAGVYGTGVAAHSRRRCACPLCRESTGFAAWCGNRRSRAHNATGRYACSARSARSGAARP